MNFPEKLDKEDMELFLKELRLAGYSWHKDSYRQFRLRPINDSGPRRSYTSVPLIEIFSWDAEEQMHRIIEAYKLEDGEWVQADNP